jgi:calcineurin-like phosphoesterase family protein
MAVWFTADHHFGHARILELAHRPFDSVEDMDATMIARWNERVAPGDLVYHLGDFAFADHTPYLARLKGQKRLVVGNHDWTARVKKAEGWSTVDHLLHIKVDDTPIVLCHYGLRVWNGSHHGALHFYGHSHGNLPGDTQSLDVGVDCWDFRPIGLDEIRARLVTLPTRIEPDHAAGSERAGS